MLIVQYLLYCPEQVPMDTCSSSAKNWGWVVTRRRCLNGSTIPVQGPTPRMGSKLPGCMYRIVASCFVEASPTVEKAVSCYKADRLVASLPSFRSVQLSLAVRKFCAAGKERCERGHGQACANLWCLMSWRPKCNSSYVSSADLPSDSIHKNLAWWVVTWRHGEPQKNTKLSKLEGGRLLGTIRYDTTQYPPVCEEIFHKMMVESRRREWATNPCTV